MLILVSVIIQSLSLCIALYIYLITFLSLSVAASEFPGGETDQRFKKQQYLDLDGICQVTTHKILFTVN